MIQQSDTGNQVGYLMSLTIKGDNVENFNQIKSPATPDSLHNCNALFAFHLMIIKVLKLMQSMELVELSSNTNNKVTLDINALAFVFLFAFETRVIICGKLFLLFVFFLNKIF